MYNALIPGCIGIGNISLQESITLARDAGFEGVSFDIFEANTYVEKHGIPALKELFGEIIPSVWNHGVDWQNDATRADSIEALKPVLAVANELGATNVTTWLMPGDNDRTYDEQYEYCQSLLRPLAQTLADGGVRLGLEFVAPKTLRDQFAHQFIYSMGDMLAFAKDMGTGNVGVLFDVWHHYCAHGTLKEMDVLTPADVPLVHINDAPLGLEIDEQLDQVRKLPMETGVIPAVEMLRKLADIGCTCGVGAEPFDQELVSLAQQNPLAAARKTAEANEKLFAAAGLR